LLGRRLIPGEATDYMEVISIGNGHVPLRASLFRTLSALFSIGSGEAIGREGPMVQMAAAIASSGGRLLRMSPAQLRLLVACGAAAGIASAYNAPIAGALFISEIVLGSIAMEWFGPLVLASVAASLVMRTFEGSAPLYQLAKFRFDNATDLAAYALLGVASGSLVPVFLKSLEFGRMAFARIAAPVPIKLALGGLVVGALSIQHPEITGNGAAVVHSLLGGELAWRTVGVILFFKLAATSATFGSGAVGGVFTPALLVGASAGSLFGTAIANLGPWESLPPSGCALIGMGAFLAGATRAPLMSILMMFEMTLNPSLLVPLMAACVLAYYVARSLNSRSLYGEHIHDKPAGLFGEAVNDLNVGQLMRKPEAPLTSETGFGEIARRFLAPQTEWLPVANAGGQFIGAILREDVEANLADSDLNNIVIAGDLLRTMPVVLSPSTKLLEAVELVGRSPSEETPVVGGNNRLEGVLGKNDLLIALGQMTRKPKSPS
jgi:CIC family chloride channel protein